MLGNWEFSKVNKEEILHDYKQKPGALIPEFVTVQGSGRLSANFVPAEPLTAA